MPDIFAFMLYLRLVSCFLLGSIPFAMLAMLGTGVDIRKIGSGNPGFNNVLRYSKPRAIATLIGDAGKGSLAIWLFHLAGDSVITGWLIAYAVVLGHCYSPFLGFKGGKGIATSYGATAVLYPQLSFPSLSVYVLGRIVGSKRKWTEGGALSSLGSWTLLVVLLLVFEGTQHAACGVLMLLFLVWRHKQNLRTLAVAGQPKAQ